MGAVSADLFATAVRDDAELRAIYEPPSGLAARKEIRRLDETCRAFIARARLVLVASAAADGRLDVSPRGGPPGFVAVLDERHLAIPDATGNRRIDSLRNVVATGHAGLLFLIAGRDQTLRVNGRACVSADARLLARLPAVGRPPRTALVVCADEVFTHCPKAFVRSALWQPEEWPRAADQPSPAEMTLAHVGDAVLTLAEVERLQAESLRLRLE